VGDFEKPDSSRATEKSRNRLAAVFEFILIFAGIAILGFVTEMSHE